ncbi:MAG: NAD-dependent protein deacetylase [Archaeoglobaceae archaeon]|nr:NAD-dependent protein deacetylase [Archaeoglobaceae archaeon]MCX8151782.1 NAD-dependent protein deacetylase [Archaeoglobaceae archaeon]MDW8013193.1 NAD-dependent protein deacetylase [Archaeoglobaceae archaeon]
MEVVDVVLKAKHLTALTGAGVSAESGVPTFRGKDGLWNKYRPEELATPEAFARNPEIVWEWYKWRMKIVFNAKPNQAHYAFAELERMGILKCLITQNVDDLHERAGSKRVLHLHGSLKVVRCTGCKKEFEVNEPPEKTLCECGSLLRPGVVWFGENLPEKILRDAIFELSLSDAIIVAGTSAVVQPAASLPYIVKRNGGIVIEVNPDVTPLTEIADISVREKAGKFMKELVDEIKLRLSSKTP